MRKQAQTIIKTLAVGGLVILIMAASPAWPAECIQWKNQGIDVTRDWCDKYETKTYPCTCGTFKTEKNSASGKTGVKEKIKEFASLLNPKTWGDRVGNWLDKELDKINN